MANPMPGFIYDAQGNPIGTAGSPAEPLVSQPPPVMPAPEALYSQPEPLASFDPSMVAPVSQAPMVGQFPELGMSVDTTVSQLPTPPLPPPPSPEDDAAMAAARRAALVSSIKERLQQDFPPAVTKAMALGAGAAKAFGLGFVPSETLQAAIAAETEMHPGYATAGEIGGFVAGGEIIAGLKGLGIAGKAAQPILATAQKAGEVAEAAETALGVGAAAGTAARALTEKVAAKLLSQQTAAKVAQLSGDAVANTFGAAIKYGAEAGVLGGVQAIQNQVIYDTPINLEAASAAAMESALFGAKLGGGIAAAVGGAKVGGALAKAAARSVYETGGEAYVKAASTLSGVPEDVLRAYGPQRLDAAAQAERRLRILESGEERLKITDRLKDSVTRARDANFEMAEPLYKANRVETFESILPKDAATSQRATDQFLNLASQAEVALGRLAEGEFSVQYGERAYGPFRRAFKYVQSGVLDDMVAAEIAGKTGVESSLQSALNIKSALSEVIGELADLPVGAHQDRATFDALVQVKNAFTAFTEDANLFGAEFSRRIRNTNQAAADFYNAARDFERAFMKQEIGAAKGVKEIDFASLEKSLKQIGTPEAERKLSALGAMLDATEANAKAFEANVSDLLTAKPGSPKALPPGASAVHPSVAKVLDAVGDGKQAFDSAASLAEKVNEYKAIKEAGDMASKAAIPSAFRPGAVGSIMGFAAGGWAGAVAGRMAGAGVRLVTSPLFNPAKSMEQVMVLQDMASRIGKSIQSSSNGVVSEALGRVTSLARRGATVSRAYDEARKALPPKKLDKAIDEIRMSVEDPGRTKARLEANLSGVSMYDPATVSRVVARQAALFEKLYAQLPGRLRERDVDAIGDRASEKMSSSERMRFSAYVKTAFDPTVALNSFSSGVVSRDYVDALKELHPEIYAQLQNDVLYRLRSMEPKQRRKLSYRSRLQLGTLLGVAADESLNPGVISALQSTYAAQGEGGTGESGGGGGTQLRRKLNVSTEVETEAQATERGSQ